WRPRKRDPRALPGMLGVRRPNLLGWLRRGRLFEFRGLRFGPRGWRACGSLLGLVKSFGDCRSAPQDLGSVSSNPDAWHALGGSDPQFSSLQLGVRLGDPVATVLHVDTGFYRLL